MAATFPLPPVSASLKLDASHIALLESQAFPTALYLADGQLGFANKAFLMMWSRFAAPQHIDTHKTFSQLLTCLNIGNPTDDFADFTSATGITITCSISPIGTGGWTVSARDVTEQRRHERKGERAQKIALIALADLAEHRDNDTGEHFQRVARLTYEIARNLKAQGHYPETITDDFLRHIGVASILHDVGKVSTPDAILHKPDRLTPEERAIMECHAASGGAILHKANTMLAGSTHFRLAAEIAECHHERWNGKGYPHGYEHETIPLSARIVAVADVYDALISERPYKKAWSQDQALDYLKNQSGIDFDPLVTAAMIEILATRSEANTIQWTEEMSVGLPIIDHDHRVLLALVNQISMPENRNDPIAVEFVLDELLGYTALHFSREEEMIEKAGYPAIRRHSAIHHTMIDEVRKLQRQQLMENTPILGDDLHKFLGNWLTTHILIEDKKYVPFMQAK